MKFYLSTLSYNYAETGHFFIMKIMRFKKVLIYLELEGQGCGIIMEVTCPLLLYIKPNKSASSVL